MYKLAERKAGRPYPAEQGIDEGGRDGRQKGGLGNRMAEFRPLLSGRKVRSLWYTLRRRQKGRLETLHGRFLRGRQVDC